MKRILFVFLTVTLFCGAAMARQPGSASYDAPEPAAAPKSGSGPGRFYYGGTLGFSFGDYTSISIAPLAGYRLTKMWSVGGKFIYEYIKDKRYDPDLTASNYGGSLFARLRPVRQLYLHAEYAYMSYEFRTGPGTSDRDWVPFLLLGGGYIQPVSSRTSVFVEVLFDVLNDASSPYEEWDPWISIGVAAGY